MWRLIALTALAVSGCDKAAAPHEPTSPPRVAPVASVASTATAPGRSTTTQTTTACDLDRPVVTFDRAEIKLLDEDPAAAKEKLARFAREGLDHPGRIAYELAAWAVARSPTGKTRNLYQKHLEKLGADPTRTGCGLLQISKQAAAAQSAGTAGAAFAAWIAVQKPRTLSKAEVDVAIAVYRELLAADSESHYSLVRAVLQVDPNAGALVKDHVGVYDGESLIAFLREMAKDYPSATWVGEIARDIANLATVGDLKNAAMRAQLAQAMVELGGISAEDAKRRIEGAAAALNE